MPSLSRSPSPSTSRPAAGVDTSAIGTGAAPQRAGNAAAQAAAGTAGAAPAPASCLDDALDTLGEMATVVLDAMPLPQAIPLAWGRRSQGWAERWLRRQPGAALLDAAGELVEGAFDAVWPVGLGFAIDGLAGAEVGFGEMALGGRFAAERDADGLLVRYGGTVTSALATGLGLKISGAEDAGMLAAKAEAKAGAGVGVEAEWRVDVPDLLRALAELSPLGVHALLWNLADPAALLRGPLARLLRAAHPVRARLAEDARLEYGAEAAVMGMADGALRQSSVSGWALGRDEGGCFAEVHLGQHTEGGAVQRLLTALGLPGSLSAAVAGDVRVRVQGDEADVAALRLDALTFEVCCAAREGDVTRADSVRLDTAAELAAHLAALANPVETLVGAEGTPVPAAELPERTLTRGVQREVEDVRALADEVPAVGELVSRFVGELLEPLDTMTDGAPVDLDLEAELGGQVAVPTEAVRAALDGAPLAPGPGGIEARVLDVARAIAADTVGGSVFESGVPELDLDAAAAEVELGRVEIVLRDEVRVGAGGSVEVGFVTGAKADAGLSVSRRHRLDELPPEDRRAVLGDARR